MRTGLPMGTAALAGSIVIGGEVGVGEAFGAGTCGVGEEAGLAGAGDAAGEGEGDAAGCVVAKADIVQPKKSPANEIVVPKRRRRFALDRGAEDRSLFR